MFAPNPDSDLLPKSKVVQPKAEPEVFSKISTERTRVTNYKDSIDRSDYNLPKRVLVKTRAGKFAESKSDKNVTSARLSLRRKIENDTTGKLQSKFTRRASNLIPSPIGRKAAKLLLKNTKKVKATSVNVAIFSWATPFWLGLHLPLAVLSLVLAGATYFRYDYLPEQAEQSGIVGKAIYSAASWVGSVFEYAAEQILNLSIDPAAMFFGLNVAVFFLGLGVMIIMTLQYFFAGINPFLGKGALFKVTAFVFALFFYIMPFFNIFPWFMLWAVAVNLNAE